MAILNEFNELVVTSRPGQAAGGPLHEMRENSVRCLGPHGLHRMAYTEWGDPANPRVLICVHGLTRNGRDFDVLANALASDYRVVCPDVVGRGRSDRMFFSDDYAVPIYANDMMTLIARLGVDCADQERSAADQPRHYDQQEQRWDDEHRLGEAH